MSSVPITYPATRTLSEAPCTPRMPSVLCSPEVAWTLLFKHTEHTHWALSPPYAMSTSQVLVPFPGSSPLEIALWHPVTIKSFYSLSILNPHSISCEADLLRMQAAVRAVSELRDLNGPDLPKLVHPPTSVRFKCRARLCLTLVIVTESDPDTDWLSCLNSDLPHHHGHACSSLLWACPYCPVAASQGLWGLGPGGWGLCPAGIVITLGGFLLLREQLVPIILSHHFSHLFWFCLCKTKFLCPYPISSSAFLTLKVSSFSFSHFNTSSHLLMDCFLLAVPPWLCESWSGFPVVWRHWRRWGSKWQGA